MEVQPEDPIGREGSIAEIPEESRVLPNNLGERQAPEHSKPPMISEIHLSTFMLFIALSYRS